jgi:hypothetical protein
VLLPPADIVALLSHFAPLFSRRVWRHVPLLVVGAILAPGRRMVSSVLHAVGLSQDRTFQTYHRVLNRAVWSPLRASRILLHLLISTFVPSGPVVLGIDETIERRRGAKIAAAGIYRDPVRSSHSHFVKVNGLLLSCASCCWCRFAFRWSRLGPAILECPGPLGTICSAARRPAQTRHTVGAPADSIDAPLAAGPLVGRRGRPRLRRPRPA